MTTVLTHWLAAALGVAVGILLARLMAARAQHHDDKADDHEFEATIHCHPAVDRTPRLGDWDR